jgi:hypothetical protein
MYRVRIARRQGTATSRCMGGERNEASEVGFRVSYFRVRLMISDKESVTLVDSQQ